MEFIYGVGNDEVEEEELEEEEEEDELEEDEEVLMWRRQDGGRGMRGENDVHMTLNLQTIIPESEMKPKFSLNGICRHGLAVYLFTQCASRVIFEPFSKCSSQLQREIQLSTRNLKNWLNFLPVVEKHNLLSYLHNFIPHEKTSRNPMSQTFYLKCLRDIWRLLYCPDFPSIEIPNLHRFMLSKRKYFMRRLELGLPIDDDSETDSDEEEEEMRSPLRIDTSSRDISNTYAQIIATINNAERPSMAKTINFECYRQNSVSSMQEKAEIFNLIENIRNIGVLELGFGCDDSVLREIGRLCRHVTSITASGKNVTDKGIEYLSGYIDNYPVPFTPSDLCSTLKYFDVSNAVRVTDYGIKTLLINFSNLQRFKCQDIHFLQVLANIKSDKDFPSDYRSSLTYFELGAPVDPRYHFLSNASEYFPKIQEMVLFNFDPFFETWTAFKDLTVIKFNNVSHTDLLSVLECIGHQILTVEIDNYGFKDYTNHADFDLNKIGALAPRLLRLSVTMCNCTVSETSVQYYQNLSSLILKGIGSEDKNVILNLLLQTPNLQDFTMICKVKMHLFYHRTNPIDHVKVLNDSILSDIITKRKMFKMLRVFLVSVDNNAILSDSYSKLELTSRTLDLLIQNCPNLVKIGNLNHWKLENKIGLLDEMYQKYKWREVLPSK